MENNYRIRKKDIHKTYFVISTVRAGSAKSKETDERVLGTKKRFMARKNWGYAILKCACVCVCAHKSRSQKMKKKALMPNTTHMKL